MDQNYVKLYRASTEPDAAYFLTEGSVYFYLTDSDKYSVSGRNLIVGATELIMKQAGTDVSRIETAVTRDCDAIKKISAEKFKSGMETYSFILNVSLVLAKQVQLTNGIINKGMKLVAGDEAQNREMSMEYFRIMDRVKTEYAKRKFPWLLELVKKFEPTLTYKRGEAYVRSAEPTRITETTNLSDQLTEYPRGSIICEQNTVGEEMFILQSGSIEVLLDNNRVATIEEPGTVTGEMALLLGEPRTATLKAMNNVVLTRIRKDELKTVAEKQASVLKGISLALARRHYYNGVRIDTLNKTLLEQKLDGDQSKEAKAALAFQKTTREFAALKDEVSEACRIKKADFLQDLVSGFKS